MLEDEILREIDVFITDDLELYLMQFPLKPVYSDSPNIISARIKPEHRVLEINVPYETSLSSNDQKLSGKAQKLISSKLNQYLSMGVGVIRDNQLHITPIQEILQIRPSFKDLEDKFGERVELMSDDEDNNTKSISMQQVQMKRKENDKNQTYRSLSYAHIQAEESAESWQDMKIFLEGSDESQDMFEKLFFDENKKTTSDTAP